MKRLLTLWLFVCVLLLAAYEDAAAQRYVRDCAYARSTVDTLTCVKQRAETAQKHLNELYKKILNTQPDHIEVSLGETQQGWIAYRNSQCLWEAEYAETGYEKIYELSCLASLTEQRVAALNAINEVQSRTAPREFSSHPRWMNALADDYPDVLWRYSQWLQADVDCDGEQEEVMTGVVMQSRDFPAVPSESQEKEDIVSDVTIPLYRAEAVIALSENMGTGRPKTRIFRLPVGENEQTMFFCNMPQELTEIVIEENSEHAEQEESCTTQIKVSDGECIPATVFWDGEQYQIRKNTIGSDEAKNLDKE
jgi:uncharacterized protein YecT (DUF1311 family)